MTSVPSDYQSLISNAAQELGIPEAIVAAQIQLESDFNPNAISPTGAEGIAQFEPATWSEYGSGSPYNATDAMNAYVKYMKVLLNQENGSVLKALEAYNAGPGNLNAGESYADTILKNANQPTSLSVSGAASPTGSVQNAGWTSLLNPLNWPKDFGDLFKSSVSPIVDAFGALETFFNGLLWIVNPANWVRIFSGVAGIVLLALGIFCLVKSS